MGGATSCCSGAQNSEEERLKNEYLRQLKTNKSASPERLRDITNSAQSSSSLSQNVTPRRLKKYKDNNDESQGGGGNLSNSKSSSMSSQKGGGNKSSSSSRRNNPSDISDSSGHSSSVPRKSSRFDQLRELVGDIVSNMGYDGIPIVRIKGNKYLIGTEVQYLQQIGSLVVVLDKQTGQEQSPLSQFLAENILKEVNAIENHMNFHDKSFIETIEMLVAKHQASQEVVKSVKRQVSQDRYIELQTYIRTM